jgi:hypothetical protein
VLRRSRLDISCYELAGFVDAYIGEASLELDIDPRTQTVQLESVTTV